MLLYNLPFGGFLVFVSLIFQFSPLNLKPVSDLMKG